jgi:hypothetical protein
MPTSPHRDASFIVRIWWEHGRGARPLWRGQVVHAWSSQARYFDQLPDLLAFIDEWTGITEPAPGSEPAPSEEPAQQEGVGQHPHRDGH